MLNLSTHINAEVKKNEESVIWMLISSMKEQEVCTSPKEGISEGLVFRGRKEKDNETE